MCGTCKHTLLSAGFRSYTVMVPTRASTVPAPTPVAPAGPPLESICAQHEHQPAVAVCDRCGDFICLLCLTPFEGRGYCLRCFELLWGRGEFGGRKHKWRVWENPTTAATLAIIAWMLVLGPFLALLPAISAIAVGVAALRRISLEPERQGQRIAIGSIIAGSLALLGSGFVTLLFYF
jgi:hypothetical protein